MVAIGLTTAASVIATPWISHADAAQHPLELRRQPANSDAPTAAAANTDSQRSTISVTVARGDTLWSIAEHHLGAGERWREIAELNRDREMVDGSTFDDARTILPGWTLLVPSADRSRAVDRVVTVEPGDTLWEIATEEYGDGTKWPRIYEANDDRIEDPNRIFPGQRFDVPGQRAEPPTIEHDQPPVEPRDTEVVPPARVRLARGGGESDGSAGRCGPIRRGRDRQPDDGRLGRGARGFRVPRRRSDDHPRAPWRWRIPCRRDALGVRRTTAHPDPQQALRSGNAERGAAVAGRRQGVEGHRE